LIKRQWLFVGFEGVMVILGVLGLKMFHPERRFREGYSFPVSKRKRSGRGVFLKSLSRVQAPGPGVVKVGA
jgi:hypothetical protein